MAPPTYGDFGKACRDIFGKGYHFGIFKLDTKLTTVGGVDIKAGGNHTFDQGRVFGNVETKYKVPKYGLTLTEKWNTDNVMALEVTTQDKIAPGFKLGLEGTFSPASGKMAGKLKSEYKHPSATVEMNVDGARGSSPLVHGAMMLGYQGWLGGCQLTFDTADSALKKNNFALGYSAGDFQVHNFAENGETFTSGFYQRCSNRLEAGVQFTWGISGESNTRFGLGTKYLLDAHTAVRAKVNNQSQIGLSFEQKLREGITLTLSTAIDGKNFKAGGHQIGVALELEQ